MVPKLPGWVVWLDRSSWSGYFSNCSRVTTPTYGGHGSKNWMQTPPDFLNQMALIKAYSNISVE